MFRIRCILLLSILFVTGCFGQSNPVDDEIAKDVVESENEVDKEEGGKEERDWSLYNTEIEVNVLESRANKSRLLEDMGPEFFMVDATRANNQVNITVNEEVKMQEFYGYGAALTHASAEVIAKSDQKDEILRSLFSTETGIGLSVIRLCIGASDFVGEFDGVQYHFTYNDLEPGETDFELEKFSITPDEEYVIPLIKDIIEINPNIKFVAAPWSAPAWMKTSSNVAGGSLKDEYLEVYARYLIKFIEVYRTHGINIDYLSLQNEPLHSNSSYATMYMSATQQAKLIRDFVGPMLTTSGFSTKIMGWDHNYADTNQDIQEEDIANFGLSLLKDDEASAYISGLAFHGYEANGLADFSKAFDKIHEQYPNTELYFTEISGGGWSNDFAANFKWNMHNIMIGLPNHYAQMVLLWNLALDENNGPHLGGCGNCRGIYTTSLNHQSAKKEVEYYVLGQISSKVHATPEGNPYVIDVESDDESIEVSGFVMPDGGIVVTLYNSSKQAKKIDLLWRDEVLNYEVMPGAAVTFSWLET